MSSKDRSLLKYLLDEVELYSSKVEQQFSPPKKGTPTTRLQLTRARKILKEAIIFVKARMEECDD